jgi:hypothetical protein
MLVRAMEGRRRWKSEVEEAGKGEGMRAAKVERGSW